MQNERPDPDQLLAEVKAQEARARARAPAASTSAPRPASARPTRCCAAARALRSEGSDVVVGVVETHGRNGNGRAARGPRASCRRCCDRVSGPHAQRIRSRCRARAPPGADPGRRARAHQRRRARAIPKRWQDIDELLASGIDVFTTLNVQHLESLNDVVGGITGITVWETVPDTFFDDADEVDAGRHSGRRAARRGSRRARSTFPSRSSARRGNFFRKGNLMALRELALRRTADRVEDDVQAYRDRPGDRARLEDRGIAALLRRPRSGGDARGRAAPRGSPLSSASNGRPSTSRRRRCSGCRATERERILQDSEARAGPWRARRRSCRASDPASLDRRVRPYPQLLEGRRRAAPETVALALEAQRSRSASGDARARRRRHRNRPRRAASRSKPRQDAASEAAGRSAPCCQAPSLCRGHCWRARSRHVDRHARCCRTSTSPTS